MRLEKRGKGELLRLLATYDERQSLDEVGAHGHDVCRRDQRAADRRVPAHAEDVCRVDEGCECDMV